MSPIDYLTPESDNFYNFSARIILENGSTEMLITNLDSSEFSLPALKTLYAKRWGIEPSFRVLKYTVGLIHLHSRKSDLVLQEVLAAFTVFNFTQAVSWDMDINHGSSKYERQVNFPMRSISAAKLCADRPAKSQPFGNEIYNHAGRIAPPLVP